MTQPSPPSNSVGSNSPHFTPTASSIPSASALDLGISSVPPLTPQDRIKILQLIRNVDSELATRYERDAVERERGVDMARILLVETQLSTFTREFRDIMRGHKEQTDRLIGAFEELTKTKQEELEQKKVALADQAAQKLADIEAANKKWLTIWSPSGTVVAILGLVVTNLITALGILWKTGHF